MPVNEKPILFDEHASETMVKPRLEQSGEWMP